MPVIILSVGSGSSMCAAENVFPRWERQQQDDRGEIKVRCMWENAATREPGKLQIHVLVCLIWRVASLIVMMRWMGAFLVWTASEGNFLCCEKHFPWKSSEKFPRHCLVLSIIPWYANNAIFPWTIHKVFIQRLQTEVSSVDNVPCVLSLGVLMEGIAWQDNNQLVKKLLRRVPDCTKHQQRSESSRRKETRWGRKNFSVSWRLGGRCVKDKNISSFSLSPDSAIRHGWLLFKD